MNNDDIQALKFYYITQHDIDEHGNVNPDARLIPLYYHNYNIDPATVTEKLSDHDIETDSNIHDGRMFDLDYLSDFGQSVYRNLPVKTRGQSVVGYASKDNAKNTYANSWRRQSPYSKDKVHIKNKNGEEYDEPVQYAKLFDNLNYAAKAERHQPFDSSKETIEEWDKSGLNDFYRMLTKNPTVFDDINNEELYKVPVIITANKNDVVTLDDMLTRGYDPGRDFLWDKQLKAYKMKQLPSGITFNNETKIKYPDLKDIFDYDNPLTLSDAQYKQVFMDLSSDRKHKNILKGIDRRY